MTYPNGFPLPEDWDADALLLLPDAAVDSEGYWLAMVRPLSTILDRYALLYSGVIDLSDASGYVLDLAGDWVNEPRGGLADNEYRLIIAGRRVALAGRVSEQRAYAGWVALTGSSDATVKGHEGSYSIHYSARVDFVPTSLYVARAGAVVRALTPTAYDAEAVVYRSDTALFDDAVYGYDTGNYAWSLRTRRLP